MHLRTFLASLGAFLILPFRSKAKPAPNVTVSAWWQDAAGVIQNEVLTYPGEWLVLDQSTALPPQPQQEGQ